MVFYPWIWLKPRYSVVGQHRLFRHELQHVYQMASLGRFGFYWTYFRLWLRRGYKNHPMELDAEAHEALPLTIDEMEWYRIGEVRL